MIMGVDFIVTSLCYRHQNSYRLGDSIASTFHFVSTYLLIWLVWKFKKFWTYEGIEWGNLEMVWLHDNPFKEIDGVTNWDSCGRVDTKKNFVHKIYAITGHNPSLHFSNGFHFVYRLYLHHTTCMYTQCIVTGYCININIYRKQLREG